MTFEEWWKYQESLAIEEMGAELAMGAAKITGMADGTVATDAASKGQMDTALALKVDSSEKGANSGVATLDASGKLTTAQIPQIAITTTSVVASEVAQLALTVQEGDVAVRSDLNKSYIALNATNASIADWQELLAPTDAVLSVAGKTGVVTLNTDDVSEGTNLYYTQTRFDSAFTAKSTTDLSEGTNLYYTDVRAKTAAVDDTAYGAGWNAVVDVAPSKNAVYDKFVLVDAAIAAATGSSQGREVKTLLAGDITNGYIELAQPALANSLMVTPKGGLPQEPGVDFTESIVVTNTRVTFAGDLAIILAAGDKLILNYEY